MTPEQEDEHQGVATLMSIAFMSACLLSQVSHYEKIVEHVEVVDSVDSGYSGFPFK